MLTFNEDLQDEDNLYLSEEDANRTTLVQFIKNLKANKIEADNVAKVDVTDYVEKLDTMEKSFKEQMTEMSKSHTKNIASLTSTINNQSSRITELMNKAPEIRYETKYETKYIEKDSCSLQ